MDNIVFLFYLKEYKTHSFFFVKRFLKAYRFQKVKALKCLVYLKVVTYTNTEEIRLWNEQKKLWNMIYLYKWKKCRVLENTLIILGPI